MRKVWQRRKCVVQDGMLSIGHSDVSQRIMAVLVLPLLLWFLCHLLNTFCLPVLLYGLEAVPPLSHANFTTLQATWRVALY